MKITIDNFIPEINDIEAYRNDHGPTTATEHVKMVLEVTPFYMWWSLAQGFDVHCIAWEGFVYDQLSLTGVEFLWWRHPAEVRVSFQRTVTRRMGDGREHIEKRTGLDT